MCKGTIKKIFVEKWPDCKPLSEEGGNSWVFKSDQEKIAIKVFNRLNNPGSRYERFKKEIGYASTLNDEGVVPILEGNLPEQIKQCPDIKTISDIPYFVMPLYAGSLSSLIGDKRFYDDGTSAVNAILQISKATKRIHDKGYSHRDLKLDNILYDENNSYFVADFGQCIDLSDLEPRKTPVDEVIGSLNYRAPELLRGRLDDSDHRPCDIFSIGRMLWALIFSEEPFQMTDLEFERKPVSSCGRAIKKARMLDDIIRGMTNIDPRARMTIDNVLNNLQEWINENSPHSTQGIIDRMGNSEHARVALTNRALSEIIQKNHQETKKYIENELDEIIREWKHIQQHIGFGNPPEIRGLTNYSSDFNPDAFGIPELERRNLDGLHVRLNFGTSEWPLLELSLYISLDLSDLSNQKYQIVAAYIPAGENPPDIYPKLAYGGEIKYFDYASGNIRQEIMHELKLAFGSLDKIFKSSLA
jgi:serine/threonine protein kinase